jgi:hypothetical protein
LEFLGTYEVEIGAESPEVWRILLCGYGPPQPEDDYPENQNAKATMTIDHEIPLFKS